MPLRPGRGDWVDVDGWSTSIVFNTGHRLRVQVTSSSNPGYDPNPNTGEPLHRNTHVRVATHAVHVDAAHPSHLLLPVVKGALP